MKYKNFINKFIVGSSVAFLTFLFFKPAYSGSNWEDILKGIKILKGGYIIDDGEWHEGLVYNAYVKFKFINGDSDNTFDNDEKVYLYIKGSDGSVYETPTDGYTKEELKAWALERAKGLLNAVFSLDPTQTTTGISNAITETQFISTTILTSSLNKDRSEYKEIRNKVGLTNQKKDSEKGEKLKKIILETFISDVKLDSEKGRIKNTINGSKFTGDTQGSLLTWERYISDNKSIGIILIYKAIDMDDYWSTETKTLTIAPNFKWIFNINKKLDISTVLYIRGSVIYFKSKLFPDGAGYFTYGGGFSLQPTYHPTEKIDLSFLAGYSISKKWIPESAVSDEIKFVAEAINSMEPIQTYSLGTNFKYNIAKNWFTELSFVYVNIFKGEGIPDGKRKADYYIFRSYYKFWKRLKFGVGYKMVRNVADYKEDTYMLTLGYQW